MTLVSTSDTSFTTQVRVNTVPEYSVVALEEISAGDPVKVMVGSGTVA